MSEQAAIIEARRIITDLAPMASLMKPSDRRYFETWQNYLTRNGDEAQINERRMVWLRALANEYSGAGIQQAAA